MNAIFKTFHWVTGLLLVISTALQLLALLGGVVLNEHNNFATQIPWLVPVWAAMLLWLIVAFVLEVKLGGKMPWPPILLVAGIVGAIAALAVAVTLRDALPDALNVAGETQGLTTWRLIYRHMGSVAVGALLAVTAIIRWIVCRIQRRQTAWDTEAASTLGLDTFADEDTPAPKRKKRSLRRK